MTLTLTLEMNLDLNLRYESYIISLTPNTKEDGQNAVNVFCCEFDMPRSEDLFHGIQHTGTDVAVDHTDGAYSQGR